MLTIGSLFTGIGGLDRGVEQGLAVLGRSSRVVWQAEKDPYARAVLARHWPRVRRYEDVHDIDESATRPDILDGGFPCQDLSIAGKRAGIDGARSGLWSEFVRIVRVLRPSVVLVENVPELLGYLGRVLGPLAELGYDAEWDLFDAAAVGAPHRRERLFVLAFRPGALAHADGVREQQQAISGNRERLRVGDDGETLPDASGHRLSNAEQPVGVAGSSGPSGTRDDGRAKLVANTHGGLRVARRWAPEPNVGRVVDGPSSRLDARRRRCRLRCLGNGVVEQQAALALVTLATRAGIGCADAVAFAGGAA